MHHPKHVFHASVSVLLCLLVMPVLAASQTPDISGRWDLDKDRSILQPMGGRGGGGGGGRMRGGGRGMGGGGGGVTIRMTITQEGNTISIAKIDEGSRGDRTRYTETFTTDGEQVTIETEAGEMTIKAEWKGKSLIVERSRSMEMRGRLMTMTTTETFTLAEDGKWMMIFVQTGGMQGGNPGSSITLMYEKKR